MIVQLAAIVFAIVTIGVIAFQLALALGAPWGAYAMGGTVPGRFPPVLRIVAVVQAIALAFLVVIILGAADVIDLPLLDDLPWLVWVAVGVAALATVLNAITRSSGERRIWFPVSLVLLITSLIVALGVPAAT